MEKDLERLRLLGIFHYIWGALSLIGGLLIGGYCLVIGIVLMTNPPSSTSSEDSSTASVAGGIFVLSRESLKALFKSQSLPGTGSVVATPPVS